MDLTKNLRLAQLQDIPVLTQMIFEFFQASPFTIYNFARDKIKTLFTNFIIDPKNYIVIVSRDDTNTPVGLIVGQKISATFTNDETAMELAWYLAPAHRQGRRAFELLDAFEAWGKATGCKVVHYSMLSTSPAIIDALYKKRGCELVEQGYQKVL